MSLIADTVYATLKEVFPLEYIEPEYYIYYKGSRLFFDFYIKSLGILVEVQGEQHFKYSSHLHGNDVEKFRAQKYRDNLKKIYIEENPKLTLVYFYDKKDKITADLVLERIYDAQNKED